VAKVENQFDAWGFALADAAADGVRVTAPVG